MATEDEVAELLRLIKLFASILRSHYDDSLNGRTPAKLLRLLLKDRHFECLIELYARQKIENRRVRAIFSEHVDELRHSLQASADESEVQLRERRLALFTQICYKRIAIDFNTISLQLNGSLALPENLREVLT